MTLSKYTDKELLEEIMKRNELKTVDYYKDISSTVLSEGMSEKVQGYSCFYCAFKWDEKGNLKEIIISE